MPVENSKKFDKSSLVFLICGMIGLVGGIACLLIGILIPKTTLPDLNFPQVPSKTEEEAKTYSNLTGLELADASLVTSPTYCVQTPNGTDGARPQVGLNEAGVVFEAIAEAGITRFAAIYQNPSSGAIGPIRSLRLYYLQWDTPFDCTIVHAGGADDAIAALRSGGYRDLNESNVYMYRGKNGSRRWNNLFTTSQKLAEFNSGKGYNSSNVNGFTRLTPEDAEKQKIDQTVAERLAITEPAKENTATLVPKVTNIAINFGNVANYNPRYTYDAETNTYKRSYASGAIHEIYSCSSEDLYKQDPENKCTLTQLAPSVVIAMEVQEKKAADRYHEDITTLGSGTAYIFQNGIVIEGTWTKNSVAEQIRFYDESGAEVALAPGQTFVSAYPNYGSVSY